MYNVQGTMIILYNLENVSPKHKFVTPEHKFSKNKTVKYRYKEAPYR